MVVDFQSYAFSPELVPKSPKVVDADGTEASSQKLPPWAVEEALRYFEQHLLLEVYRPAAESSGDLRAEMCAAHFRSLIDSWRPDSAFFWRDCQEFSKRWAPGPRGEERRGSPRSRPLCAGRLTNYLTRLSRSAAPNEFGDINLCGPEEAFFPPEVCFTAARFGIRVSDIRCTCPSVFDSLREWTGLDWGKDSALDPCPWPVPEHLDGLRCSWRTLAAPSGYNRVYLNPPWSKLDIWLYKAVCECRQGLPVLALVPAWLDNICADVEQFVRILDKQDQMQECTYQDVRSRSPSRKVSIRARVFWDAEFAHPTTGAKMPPLNVMAVWLQSHD
jgi:hypothetical protein